MKTLAKGPSKDRRCALRGAALALLSLITISPSLISPSIVQAATTDSPFTALPGSWAGTGTIARSSGAKERIRCRATYRLENPVNLRLEMNCSSDSYRFELRSHITYDAETVSGLWNEQTRGVGGIVTGRASGARIQVRAEGQTFTALLDMTTRGNRQSVSIQSPGSEMSGVTIMLTRGAR
jgi:hypothetical protein